MNNYYIIHTVNGIFVFPAHHKIDFFSAVKSYLNTFWDEEKLSTKLDNVMPNISNIAKYIFLLLGQQEKKKQLNASLLLFS